MPFFSQKSKSKLNTCRPNLQKLFNTVIEIFDCTIIEGNRSILTQKYYLKTGKTKTLKSKHLSQPSLAVDVAPYPIDWEDTHRFYYFAGIVKGIAHCLDISIRWGGDWDGGTQVSDQKFNDLVHFELSMESK